MEESVDIDLDPEEDAQPDEYATRKETEAALSALTSGDKKKMVAATFWWKKYDLRGTAIEPEDLLQEAFLRTLKSDSPRRWRNAVVSIVKHFGRGIESVATHH